jgi:hypothetical protein
VDGILYNTAQIGVKYVDRCKSLRGIECNQVEAAQTNNKRATDQKRSVVKLLTHPGHILTTNKLAGHLLQQIVRTLRRTPICMQNRMCRRPLKQKMQNPLCLVRPRGNPCANERGIREQQLPAAAHPAAFCGAFNRCPMQFIEKRTPLMGRARVLMCGQLARMHLGVLYIYRRRCVLHNRMELFSFH